MGTIVFLLGSLALVSGLAWMTYLSAKLLRSVPLRENLLLAPLENVFKVGLVLACAALAAASGLPPQQFGLVSTQPVMDLAVGILAGLSTQLIVNVISDPLIARFGKGIYSTVVLRNIFPRNRREWLLVPAAMGLAVLLEEVLFRGLLLGGWSTWLPAPLLLLLLGILFGIMHSPQGALGMVFAAVAGCGLSLLFLWTGSLLAPFVAHYIINMLQLLRAREEWQRILEY